LFVVASMVARIHSYRVDTLVQVQGLSSGALGPLGGHGAVLRMPRAEAFTKLLFRDIAKPY